MDAAIHERAIEIAVSPPSALAGRRRLFAALEAAFPVAFQPASAIGSPDGVIEIATDGEPAAVRELVRHGTPAVGFGGFASTNTTDVRLLAMPAVDRRLHDITLAGQLAGDPLRPADLGEVVLAHDRLGALWTASGPNSELQRIAAPLPELSPSSLLRDAIFSSWALAVIALVQFIRAMCKPSGWRPPPLRAAFVFDDPNVRWRRYGFINYRELVEHSDAHGYHASMAMVPADASHAHGPTVALFKRRRDRLSLAIHGNNHVKRELMLPLDLQVALAVCAQALRRVAAFEARTQLRVDRVMMPPHGMCSQSVTRALGALGFDALCAIHPVPWHERPLGAWLAGWDPATYAGPSAVIPRFPLSASTAEIALRAFMDHPLVLYGHHEDLSRGLEPLAEAAQRVNRLGEVNWGSLAEISESNFACRTAGDTLVVRPFSARLRLDLPENVRHAVVERPRDAGGAFHGWSSADQFAGFDAKLRVSPREPFQLRLHPGFIADPRTVAAPTWRPWPAVRRVATEARDRAMPLAR